MKKIAVIALIGMGASLPTLAADAVADFRKLVDACKTGIAARPATEIWFNQHSNAWMKLLYSPAETSFDVKKTDSLIRPFQAYIEVSWSRASARAADEQGAKDLEISLDGKNVYLQKSLTRMTYVYDDGTWRLGDTLNVSTTRSMGETDFPKPFRFDVPAERFLENFPELVACLPKRK